MDFPKKQAQRLIPLHLLDYATQLQISHPDPTESWGGSGGTYTGGDGIDISSENVISVDNTIAKKSDIPSLDGYATQTWVQNQGYSTFSGSYNDLTDKPTIPDTTNLVTTDTNQTIVGTKKFTEPLEVIYGMTSNSTTVNGQGNFVYRDGVKDEVTIFGLPRSKTGGTEANPTTYTLATTDDIPTVPTLATVATTGSYNDLIDKPTIPDTTKMVTTDTDQTISGFKTFDSAKLSVEKSAPIRMKLTFRPNMFMYYSGDSVAYFNLPTSKPKGTADAPTEYTLATIDDIPNATNVVTLDTAQTISGAKTFEGGPICSSLGGAYTMQPLGVGVLRFNDVNSTKQIDFSLPIEKSGTEYTIATNDDIPTSATSTSTLTPTTETLVFTLSDNSTVEVNVMTSATVSTTTTLS